MTAWTSDVATVWASFEQTRASVLPSQWWLDAERYDDGLLVTSGRHRGAIYAEPLNDREWLARWWYLPDSGDSIDVEYDYGPAFEGDVEFLRLRVYTAMAVGSEGDASIVFDAGWVEERQAADGEGGGSNVLSVITMLLFDQHLRVWLPSLYDAAPDVHFSYVGGAAPLQAFGMWSNHNVYFRYRSGRASLSLSTKDPVTESQWQAFMEYGDEADSWLSWDAFAHVFTLLTSKLMPGLAWYLFETPDSLDGVTGVMAFSEADARSQLAEHQRAAPLVSDPFDGQGASETPPFVLRSVVPPPVED